MAAPAAGLAKGHYELLGCSPDATAENIRRAYRKAALQCHPDKNPADREQAEEMFKKVAAAYQVLSNPETRAAYDRGDLDVEGHGKQNKAPAKKRRRTSESSESTRDDSGGASEDDDFFGGFDMDAAFRTFANVFEGSDADAFSSDEFSGSFDVAFDDDAFENFDAVFDGLFGSTCAASSSRRAPCRRRRSSAASSRRISGASSRRTSRASSRRSDANASKAEAAPSRRKESQGQRAEAAPAAAAAGEGATPTKRLSGGRRLSTKTRVPGTD
eukprot:TRINITY_DN77142_c0_g1_i1.p1 TRINITY_DN77142_c0_g1~~TRINITY_DN77142_c0_g1_i1.p1  ORF type:complete len:272 (+),score=70.61 TRINITY_DN77142_c0_g1_i1:73-888(+)